MKAMPLLKKAAWLACAVVLSELIFNAVVILISMRVLQGVAAPALLVLSLSLLAGYVLCRRASRLDVFLIGIAVAAYMPAGRAILWIAAFVQDLIRGGDLPGISLTVMMNLPPNNSVMFVMALIAIFMTLSGFFASKRTAPQPLKA